MGLFTSMRVPKKAGSAEFPGVLGSCELPRVNAGTELQSPVKNSTCFQPEPSPLAHLPLLTYTHTTKATTTVDRLFSESHT